MAIGYQFQRPHPAQAGGADRYAGRLGKKLLTEAAAGGEKNSGKAIEAGPDPGAKKGSWKD